MKTMFAMLLLLFVGGCVVHAHGHAHHRPVVVEAAHIHSDHCGHYHWRGQWYISHGHRHGPGCGHVHRGGMWIVID
jgi:hypothetical protein